ncbi:hypothetical protein HS088_TW06G01433 [Tripterygium wilfordii]|uniref:Localized to the inner membrane of the chloroplast n=1 Tax=Tripterygium wilfordii TaxID=458696 RepID=A0A7J7DLK8_TRIWF|nr:uncharacterized protein LOC119999233 [Tripterygium wilfordii]KAF5747252.1 hypothetical protein HS088_TW06G01433 [Tripterygium wilfordii]
MSSISTSLALTRNPLDSPVLPVKPLEKSLGNAGTNNVSFCPSYSRKAQLSTSRGTLRIQASYRDDGSPSSASVFVGGFVLGGLIVGALGCVYAPQISKALTGTDRKDLMRKLPKFIYDEEKALEKTRKVLAEKIAQLNSAIDDVSSQLRTEDVPNGAAVNSDEIEAAI